VASYAEHAEHEDGEDFETFNHAQGDPSEAWEWRSRTRAKSASRQSSQYACAPHETHLSFFTPKEHWSQRRATTPFPQWFLPQFKQLSFFVPKPQEEHSFATAPLPQWLLPQEKQLSFFDPNAHGSQILAVAAMARPPRSCWTS
jgi:hypothetical protein